MTPSPFFDLYRELTTNVDFINKATACMSDITKAERSGNRDAMREHMQDLLRLCEFNPSLLVPYYFPAFPDRVPMTLWSRPHAFAMMSFIIGGSLTINSSRQIGKCMTVDTKLVTCDDKGCKSEEKIGDLFNNAKYDLTRW